MIRNILVGLDGSAGSRAATELVVEWSKQTGAEVTGLTIVDDRPDNNPVPSARIHSAGVRSYLDRVVRMRDETEQYRNEFAARCSAAGVHFTTKFETDDPVEVLTALHEDYDLTMLAKETRFRWYATDDEPDDTVSQVLRRSRRPVVAVPRQLPAGDAVVVAYDGGAAAVDALRSFAESGLGAGHPVSVVSVAADADEGARKAEEAARFLSAHGITATPEPVATRADEADVIGSAAERIGAEMIVMGAYSHGRFREWFDRSTTTRVLAHARQLLYLHHHPNP